MGDRVGLRAGGVGTVVMVRANGGAYEVELMALGGQTLAMLTLSAEQVRPVDPREIAHVRKEVSSGRYGSASEVVRDALRYMEERNTKLAVLRAACPVSRGQVLSRAPVGCNGLAWRDPCGDIRDRP